MNWKKLFKELLADPTVKSVEVTQWEIYESEDTFTKNPIFKVEKFDPHVESPHKQTP